MTDFTTLFTHVRSALPSIVSSIPAEWRGTTFKNLILLGREQFAVKLQELILSKVGSTITTEDLTNLGNAEDYLRVSTNISCVLEYYLATEKGYHINQVFTFGSEAMPIVAVLLTTGLPVHYYVGENGSSHFTSDEIELLKFIDCELHLHFSAPVAHPNAIVLVSNNVTNADLNVVDGIVHPNILYIHNLTKIIPSKILVIRKRMSSPLTTPVVESILQSLAGLPITTNNIPVDETKLHEFYSHLQVLSGTDSDATQYPICFTVGLAALCSLWVTLILEGGSDVVMASTAYGGSSELTDILTSRTSTFRKHKFDITGKNDISEAISNALNQLSSSDHNQLAPITTLFVEIPTNPDMKVPDMIELALMLEKYQNETNKKVLLLVDTTFAPGSKVMEKIHQVAPNLTTMVFISMSKSVSRGYTTAGTLVAGRSELSSKLLHHVKTTARMLDTQAKPDQLVTLINNHIGVEERCQKAYEIAVAAGEILRNSVKQHCNGYDMPLAFVTPEQANAGFSSSTFSFNLPAFEGASSEVNEALAQRFVDLLCENKHFKPCVSFGQDNGLVYCTVPATSTQGAIKAEDKAKQAVGGVQLTRLSFPPNCDLDSILSKIAESVAICYSK